MYVNYLYRTKKVDNKIFYLCRTKIVGQYFTSVTQYFTTVGKLLVSHKTILCNLSHKKKVDNKIHYIIRFALHISLHAQGNINLEEYLLDTG